MGKKNKKKKKRRIRPLALCVFRRGGKIFVARGYDAHTEQVFYRPIGGKIEFGEHGSQAVKREVMEELGAAVEELTWLGALENIFSYENAPGHEIVLIYDGRFADPALNQDDIRLQGKDGDRVLYQGSWKSLEYFRGEAAPPLYPAGLLELLERAGKRSN